MEEILKKYRGKKILVTGANGFIGTRLIEILSTVDGCEITAVVRNFGNAIRLARLPIKIVKGDILDKITCQEYFDGVDYVFHCAYGNSGSFAERKSIDEQGTSNVLEMSRDNKCSGMLFLSTVAVYGIHQSGVIDEDASYLPTSDEYATNKKLTENLIYDFHNKTNFPVVILQPTGVYGPWAKSFGSRFIKQFQKKYYLIDKDSFGIANLVYVDDLVQAMLKAIICKEAYGKKYLITGPDNVSWRDFFLAFQDMMGEKCFEEYSKQELAQIRKIKRKGESFLTIMKSSIAFRKEKIQKLRRYRLANFLINAISHFMTGDLKKQLVYKENRTVKFQKGKEPVFLDNSSMDFYYAKSIVLINKAIAELGYKPQFPFKMGFEVQKEWYGWFSDQINK